MVEQGSIKENIVENSPDYLIESQSEVWINILMSIDELPWLL